jgi:hypothetical protein
MREGTAEVMRIVEEAFTVRDDLLQQEDELMRSARALEARLAAIEAELAFLQASLNGVADAPEVAHFPSDADEQAHGPRPSAVASTTRDDDHLRLDAALAALAKTRAETPARSFRIRHLERRLAAALRLQLLPRRLPAARSRRPSTRRQTRARARAPDRPSLASDCRTPGGKPGCFCMPTEGKRE